MQRSPQQLIPHRKTWFLGAIVSSAVLFSENCARGQSSTGEVAILELVENYCVDCHNADKKKGEFDIESIFEADITEHSNAWEAVVRRLQSRQMPPPDRKRPAESDYDLVLGQLIGTLDARAASDPKPGRVETFRRLNRTEYQNAIRDLLAVEIDAAAYLPKDEESHGFDNITVGTLSPALLDRYISAAQKISRLAVGTMSTKPGGETFRIRPDLTQEKHVEGLPIGTRGGGLFTYTFPQDGEYKIEVLLARDRNEHVEGMRGKHEMEILIDRQPVETFSITGPGADQDHSKIDKHLNLKTFVKAGVHKVGVTFVQQGSPLLENKRQPFEASYNMHRHPRRGPAVYQVSITGPFDAKGAGETASRAKIFIQQPADESEQEPAARVILTNLMKRAFRRAIADSDLENPMAFYREGAATEGGFDAGIESALSAILVSPEFLFRIEKEPEDAEPGKAYAISDVELASRLSFFIWSSLPDDELLDLAIAGKLREAGVLEAQVRRMLADARSISLVNNFASQWLHLRNLESVTPNLRMFPDFDDNLRQAFRKETELFVESILREDRSVVDLLKADYTFLNERLARHYGIPNIIGSRFRRVNVDPAQHRGGLLRQGRFSPSHHMPRGRRP
ncbi:MAG: DUF1592 domain-containing protein [Verrucomicrobiales bacterium]